jgi:flagellar hook-associated protein FlgK
MSIRVKLFKSMTKKKLQNLIRANQTFKDKINKINQLHKKIKKITIKIMSMKIKVKNKLEGNKKFFI